MKLEGTPALVTGANRGCRSLAAERQTRGAAGGDISLLVNNAGANRWARLLDGEMSDIRLELADSNVIVSALHVGFMDTDMTETIGAPKSDPAKIARLALDGIEAGAYEIVADDSGRRVLAGLSGGVAALYSQLP